MKDKTINLVDAIAIENYLKRFCEGDERIAFLLNVALGRIIKKMPECMETLSALPENAPDWLRQKWTAQPEWHVFKPNKYIRLAGRIDLAVSWLRAAVENDMPWLANVDDRGRPYRLLKLASLDDVKKATDEDYDVIRARRREEVRIEMRDEALDENIKTILSFPDGYSVVRLLTARALDRESAFLEHCVGDGAYDKYLEEGSRFYYYSLRAPDNIPCVTICANGARSSIHQLAGKRNAFPDHKYLPYIAALCVQLKLDLASFYAKSKKPAQDIDADERALYAAADNKPEPRLPRLDFDDKDAPVTLADDLRLRGLSIANIANLDRFPRNLRVEGDVKFHGRQFPATPPDGMIVTGQITTHTDVFATVEAFIAKHYPEKAA